MCKAFVDTKCFFTSKKKKKNCTELKNNASTQLQIGLAPELLQNYKGTEDDNFMDLLSRYNDDKKGRFSWENLIVKQFGRYLYKQKKKNRRQNGKEVESRKVIKQNMRMTAGLHLKFEEIGTRKGLNNLEIEDMLSPTNWDLWGCSVNSL